MGSRFHVHLVCLVVALTIIQGIHGIKYEVTVNAKGKGARRFDDEIGYEAAERIMKKAANFVWFTIFKQFSAGERKNVQEIHLFIEAHMDENSNYKINDEVHEICVSAKFIRNCDPGQLNYEINALIFYEIAHILQWTAPEDQISPSKEVVAIKDGIAGYAVLMANYKPKEWVNFGEGDTWNESIDVMAQFLVYCSGRNPGFVPYLNRKMRESSFSKSYFLDFFNMDVEDLWKDYKHGGKA